MKRIIVLGGFGFFGSVAVERLRVEGFSPLIASRRPNADLIVDVENQASIRRVIRSEDILIDAVGPFQDRTTLLIETAVEIGFDVIDIADSLNYVQSVYKLRDRIDKSNTRVFTACSTVSAISAVMVALSGISKPIRISGFLVPAARYTAVTATAASLFNSVGQAIHVFEKGKLMTRQGWDTSRQFDFMAPPGNITGYLIECADSITLPEIWPSLRTIDYYVDTNVLGLNSLFCIAVRFPRFRALMEQNWNLGLFLSRLLGSTMSGLGYEIEGDQGNISRFTVTSEKNGYAIPVAPAVLVTRALAEGRVIEPGLIPSNQHVNPQELLNYLENNGSKFSFWKGGKNGNPIRKNPQYK